MARRLSTVVPIGRDGVALALARTLSVAPELLSDRAEVMAAIAGHRFHSESRGGRLAAMATGLETGATPPSREDRLPVELSQTNTSELLLRAEEYQYAFRCSGDPEADLEARRCIRTLLNRRAASGRWFPDRLVDDRLNLSALDGLPALGRVLLRCLRPDLPVIGILA